MSTELGALIGVAVLALLTAIIKMKPRTTKAMLVAKNDRVHEEHDLRIRALSARIDALHNDFKDHLTDTSKGYQRVVVVESAIAEIRKDIEDVLRQDQEHHESLKDHLEEYYALRERVTVLEELRRGRR